MTIDPELLSDFTAEIQSLKGELNSIVASLKKTPNQPPLFAQFGQVIDRIFGTAGTFGLKELADYCGMLKKTCYACAEPGTVRAQSKVLGLMENCLTNLDALMAGINDPAVTKKIHHALHLESQKAQRLHEEIFKYVKKAA